MRQNFIVISTRRSPESVRPPLTLHRRVMSPHHHTASFRLFAPSPMMTSSLPFANFRISSEPQTHFQLIFWRTMWTSWRHSSLNYLTGRCHPGVFPSHFKASFITRYWRSRIWTHLMGSHIDLYRTSVSCQSCLSDLSLGSWWTISTRGNWCQHCSQHIAPTTRRRIAMSSIHNSGLTPPQTLLTLVRSAWPHRASHTCFRAFSTHTSIGKKTRSHRDDQPPSPIKSEHLP